MKILAPGRPQRGWAIETKCSGSGNGDGGCGATLLVEQDDLFKTYSHCRDETDTHVTFRCAACGVLTDLARKTQPPSNIVSGLPERKEWEKTHPHESAPAIPATGCICPRCDPSRDP